VSEPDDQRLVSELRAGRPEACAAVVRAHYQAVYRWVFHLTGDAHQAEDLTQDTFAAAWEHAATFEGRAALGTWLHRIAYTKFIDAQRARRRAERVRERLPLPPAAPDPLNAAMADDDTRRLYRALEELDAAERAVLVLHYLQGLSYREMAAVLDEPTGTVKWRTAEALNRLRTLLKEAAGHEPRRNPQPGFIPGSAGGAAACLARAARPRGSGSPAAGANPD
jgi:RNA polymerase sigma-70 factor (ECF subfamily)